MHIHMQTGGRDHDDDESYIHTYIFIHMNKYIHIHMQICEDLEGERYEVGDQDDDESYERDGFDTSALNRAVEVCVCMYVCECVYIYIYMRLRELYVYVNTCAYIHASVEL